MHLWFRLFLLCLAGYLQASAHAGVPFEDSMAQRTLACTACHGAQGRAGPDGYYPRLAGKPAAYLFNQLQNFRAGRRHYALMSGLLDSMDEAYLQDIADYFAALSLPYPAPAKAAQGGREMERGRRLVQNGNPAQGLPACTQCHGLQLTGVLPATPGPLGLPADYLNAQLGGWQTGQRHAGAPDCMEHIAKQLSPSDTSAVARWLAAQPLPANSRAAERKPALAAGARELRCGSDAVRATQTSASAPIEPAGAAIAAVAASPPASDAVRRGAYLARIGNCAQCHTARGGMAYAGGLAIATPFGSVFSSNITPERSHGIGNWSAQDFWQALHEGRSQDGHLLYPAFPYTSYTRLSRADSDALFAFLQTVPPSAQANQAHALRWPYSTQLALQGWRALYFRPSDAVAATAPTPPGNGSTPMQAGAQATAHSADWQRGQYLVQGLGHCLECHAARNAFGARLPEDEAGGSVLAGSQWLAPALNDAAGASVASWSEADIATFLQTGRNTLAQASGPMAEVVLHGMQYLSDSDAHAMAVYLKALPQRGPQPPPAGGGSGSDSASSGTSSTQGSKLYADHCADCHGAQGQGRAGAYPALAGNRAVMQEPPNNLIHTVLEGGFAPATAGNPRPYGMPPFVLRLSDAELAAVLSYVRSAWGNRGAAISEFDINKFRRAQAP